MAKRSKKGDRIPTESHGAEEPFNNPFAAALAHVTPTGAAAPEPETETEPKGAPPAPSASGKVVVRKEKKGRGGKTVTRIHGLDPSATDLEDLARRLKRALGCGATVEDEDIILQGEQAPRAKAWLEEQGVKRVVVGS